MTLPTYDFKGNFYEWEQNNTHPTVIEAIVERFIIYLAQVLYGRLYDEDPQEALNKILISDVEAGSSVSIGDAIEYFKSTNVIYPFTVYTIGEPQSRTKETNNQRAALGQYCSVLNRVIRAFPASFELPTVSFFNTALDYQTARTKIGFNTASLTRLYAPILFNETEVNIPFDVSFEISRGAYAYQFEQHLIQNKIWDINAVINIQYYEYELDEVTVGLVDNMLIRLGQAGEDGQTAPIIGLHGADTVPDPLEVIATNPEDGDTDVSVDTSVTITLSRPIVASTVNIDVDPIFDHYVDQSVNTITITPKNSLSGETEYTFVLLKSVTDADDTPLLEDFEFGFFTEVV